MDVRACQAVPYGGETEKCVDLCDEMSLWFSHGDYVRRAMDLKKSTDRSQRDSRKIITRRKKILLQKIRQRLWLRKLSRRKKQPQRR